MRAPARVRSSGAGVALVPFALVLAVGVSDGGYFSDSWTWIVVALASAGGLAALLRARIELGVLELATMAAFAALVGWTALSATWSAAPRDSVEEAGRGLVYLAAIVALPLLMDRDRIASLLGGLTAGIALVVGYGFLERLLFLDALAADPVGGTRLVEPIGYANALGIMAVVGTVLSVGFAANGETRVARALGAAGPMLFLPALTLTDSRGAWVGLAVGVSAWSFFEVERARFLVTAAAVTPPAIAAVLLTDRASALTDLRSTAGELDDAGRALAAALVVLAVASVFLCLGARRLEARVPPHVTWISYVLLPTLLGAMALAATVRPRRALDVRVDYWRVARDEFEQNAILGSGAGTFVRYWERSGIPAGAQDAHSLYLETLAELGPLGLGLLVVALGLPVAAGLRSHRAPYAGVALGAYAAYLAHAGLDWDWEMPAVTLTALVCAVGLLASDRAEGRLVELGVRARTAFLLFACVLVALSFALRLTGG